jgi:hypothetical protein
MVLHAVPYVVSQDVLVAGCSAEPGPVVGWLANSKPFVLPVPPSPVALIKIAQRLVRMSFPAPMTHMFAPYSPQQR